MNLSCAAFSLGCYANVFMYFLPTMACENSMLVFLVFIFFFIVVVAAAADAVALDSFVV